jgi:hypothetical protein
MGYKQELRRQYSTLQVFAIAFSIMGLVPSIASTLSFSLPAGPVGMVWVWDKSHIGWCAQLTGFCDTGMVHGESIHLVGRAGDGMSRLWIWISVELWS